MGKIGKILEFIRAMKKSNRKQVIGSWYAVDPKTNEVCGCAMGQALLNLDLVTEDEVRNFANKRGYKAVKKIYDPITRKSESKTVIACSVPYDSVAYKYLDENIPAFLREDVMQKNDREEMPVGDIAAKMYEKYADQVGA